MKKSIITFMVIGLITLFSNMAFSQADFTVSNVSGYQLYGLMVSEDGENWSDDLLTESEFPNGTETVVTIPEGYTCEIYFMVSYMVNGEIYEELLSRANVCDHSGMKIKKNPNGKSGSWMTTQYLD